MGIYDLPAMIELIKTKSKVKKITYIGHSQGTTQLFVGFSEKPQYFNKNLNGFIGLGPITKLNNIKSTFLKAVAEYGLDNLFNILGINEVFPSPSSVNKLGAIICDNLYVLCSGMLQMLSDNNLNNDDKERFLVFISHFPSGASLKTLNHFSLIYKQKEFVNIKDKTKYDYFSKIEIPVSLFVGKEDKLSTPEGSREIRKNFWKYGNLHFYREYENMGHATFFLTKSKDYLIDVLTCLEDYNYFNNANKQQMYNPNMINYNIPIQNMQNPANSQMLHQMQNNMIPNYNPSVNIPISEPPKKERLRLKMTQEEKGYFQNLYSIADKKNEGRLYGKDAADFLKKSGLPKDVLKNIWIMSAQTDPQFLERDEFYLALRLISLAQNNLEVSEESVKLNHPIPPLPKIDLKSPNPASSNLSSSVSLDQSISSNFSIQTNSNVPIAAPEKDDFTFSEEDDNKYTVLFNKNKDLPDKISFHKINEMFVAAKIPSETLKKIFDIVQLSEPNFLNIYEFKVVFHLIYKSYVLKDVPVVLPNSLKYVLSHTNKSKGNEIDFSLNSRNANVAAANQSSIINNQNIPITSESMIHRNPAEIESVLLQEFNLQNETNSNLNNPILENNNVNQNQINAINNNKVSNLNYSNINQNELLKIITTVNNSLNNHIQEGEFLQNILESDKHLLNSLIDDAEKINKQIIIVTEKNKFMRDEILEYRRKINMERDNLIKATNKLYGQTNEIINTKDEHQKIKEEYNNVLFENNNQSAQIQAQSTQFTNNAYTQNNSWANPMNYNPNANPNYPQNPNEHLNYHQNQTYVNPNHSEMTINAPKEKLNAPISNNHSRNVSINKDLTIPNHLDNGQNSAHNSPHLNNLNNNAANNTFSPPINSLSAHSNDEANMAMNNFNNNNLHENPNSNFTSRSVGEVGSNDVNFKIPASNNLSLSSVNLTMKETNNANVITTGTNLASSNQMIINDNPQLQGGYPTLETDLKSEENNNVNNFKSGNLNTNIPNPNTINNKEIPINPTSFNNNTNVGNQMNPNPNANQFNFNANNGPSKRESDFDFDFNGYDKVDTFKDIANKKGEDLFKNANNNFESDWDF